MTRRALWLSGLLLAGIACLAYADTEPTAPEYQVKAAFIYKFATYIRWPPATASDASGPFVIGVIGKDPFGAALDAVVRGQTVQGKSVVVKRLTRVEEARCDVIFIASSERPRLKQILTALRGSQALTVGDMDQFAEQGGMINLITTDDNQIRFDINRRALDRAGLKAPSQLLRLARIVGGSP